MVNFHYKHMKSKYGKNATLIYSDTYSLIYLITTDAVYEGMLKYNDMFDFSDCPTDHKLYKMNIIGKDEHGKNIINCKVPGNFKEDNNSNVCKKWLYVGLSHMLKSLFLLLMIKVKDIQSIKKTGKGVPSHIIQKKLHCNMYEDSLCKKKVFENNYNAISSVKHKVNT